MFSRQIRNFWLWRKPNFGNFALVEPCNVSAPLPVPEHIPKPSYFASGQPREVILHPEIKSEAQITQMRNSCKLAANVLQKAGAFLKVGQTTDELDKFVHDLIIAHGAYPSPLNYRHFPKSVCTSINNVACHGIPDDRPLQNGDIINVDITVYYQGYHGDCSRTFLVGDVDKQGQDLVNATELCLYEAIKLCRPGQQFAEIGRFLGARAQNLGFRVIPAFIGHGIGQYFHGPPEIYHTKNSYAGEMQPGMTFTIEPVLTQGGEEIVILEDNWTAVTVDFARTAQFEHTVLVNESGAEVLTTPD